MKPKIKEEYSLAEDFDDLVALDQKYFGVYSPVSNTARKKIDQILEEIEKKAPLNLQKWMRKSTNERNQNFRKKNKDKKRRSDSLRNDGKVQPN